MSAERLPDWSIIRQAKPESPDQEHHLLLVTRYDPRHDVQIPALTLWLSRVVSLAVVTRAFVRIGILTHHYLDGDAVQFHGYLDVLSANVDSEMREYMKKLRDAAAVSEGMLNRSELHDFTKHALALSYEVMDKDATTVLIVESRSDPMRDEPTAALEEPGAYGGYGQFFVDWAVGCTLLAAGEKRCVVFPTLMTARRDVSRYLYLAHVTGGICFTAPGPRSDGTGDESILVPLLLEWMGGGCDSSSRWPYSKTAIMRYTGDMSERADLIETGTGLYREEASQVRRHGEGAYTFRTFAGVVEQDLLGPGNMAGFVPHRFPPVTGLDAEFRSNPKYRAAVKRHLPTLLVARCNRSCQSPLLTGLWKAVCAESKGVCRDAVICATEDEIRREVGRNEKTRLSDLRYWHTWLQSCGSRSLAAPLIVEAVKTSRRYPCIYFRPESLMVKPDYEELFSDNRRSYMHHDLHAFLHDCNKDNQRRLADLLTGIRFAESARDVPVGVRDTISLSMEGTNFIRVFLHLILPGVILQGQRSVGLLSAMILSLDHLQPMWPLAREALDPLKRRWFDFMAMEDWTLHCCSLITSANNACISRGSQPYSRLFDGGFLSRNEKTRLETAVSHEKLSETTVTSLVVKTGFVMKRSRLPLGPTAMCRECGHERSVTIMCRDSKCEICTTAELSHSAAGIVSTGALKKGKKASFGTWVECNNPYCRVNLVVDDLELDGRKVERCRYCTHFQMHYKASSGCEEPELKDYFIECRECRRRVLFLPEYQPIDGDAFECEPCKVGLFQESKAAFADLSGSSDWLDRANNKRWLWGDYSRLTDDSEFAYALRYLDIPEDIPNLKSKLGVVCKVPELLRKLREETFRYTTEPTFKVRPNFVF